MAASNNPSSTSDDASYIILASWYHQINPLASDSTSEHILEWWRHPTTWLQAPRLTLTSLHSDDVIIPTLLPCYLLSVAPSAGSLVNYDYPYLASTAPIGGALCRLTCELWAGSLLTLLLMHKTMGFRKLVFVDINKIISQCLYAHYSGKIVWWWTARKFNVDTRRTIVYSLFMSHLHIPRNSSLTVLWVVLHPDTPYK